MATVRPQSRLPLDGIRVLEFGVVWAGPYCAAFLAGMGAEVIKMESTKVFIPSTRGQTPRPTEELLKTLPPSGGGTPGRVPGKRPWNRMPLFNAHGSNKVGMTVDLLLPKGQEVLRRLISVSDVIVENNPTQTMEKLGISYEMLKEINPSMILLRMPAYANEGPYQNHRSFGFHIEGVVGHTLMRGYSDMDASAATSVLMGDAASGTQGAFAVLAALHYRRRTGKGQLIELSQAENLIPFMGEAFMDFSMNGRNQSTLGNRHPNGIQGCYPCLGDDRWVCITIRADDEWRGLLHAMGDPAWSQDEKLNDPVERRRRHDEIDEKISAWTKSLEPYDVMLRLQEKGVAAGSVMDQRDAFSDPHLNHRGAFEEAYQEDTGTHLYPGAPYKMSETPAKIRRGPVRLGEDNQYLYQDLLGYTDQEYAALEEEGHIGMDYHPDVK
jgi:crotonobetainyl-CoA:carnitine CoA-transferase CaiB-like acyl-CoA transferase